MLAHHTFTPEGVECIPTKLKPRSFCPFQPVQYDGTQPNCERFCALYDTEHDCCSLKGNPGKVAAVQKARRVAGKP